MTEATRLVRDDGYGALGDAYQRLLIAALDGVLQEQGISDPEERRQACSAFVARLGDFHDEFWIRADPEGDPVFPLLCFTQKYLNTTTPVEHIGVVHVPPPTFAFRAHARANVNAYFRGDPTTVQIGVFRGDDEL